MKTGSISIIVFLLLATLSSCKTYFEEVRTSNDPEKILKAANEFYEAEDYLKAQALYEVIIPFYRGKQQAEDLFFNYAYTYYHLGQYMLAAHYFNSFKNTFYNSPRREEAAFMSAYSNYELSPTYKLDQEPSRNAINELQAFINTYPNSPRVDEANVLIDEMRYKLETKAYHQGKLYYQLENYSAAITSFENMLKDFPETKRVEEVRYLIIKSSFDLAVNSVYEKTRERLEATVEKSTKFAARYPDSKYLDDVLKIQENSNKELKRFTDDGYQE